MGLYRCEECGCVENTALARYHLRGDGRALCSACDPQIGRWHDAFPRRQWVPGKDKTLKEILAEREGKP